MRGELVILGIETSCDETAASVVRWAGGRARVLSDVVWSQNEAHAPYQGVVPEIAARAHVEKVDSAIAEAMAEARLGFDDLSGIAATAGPGLIGGVMVGLTTAKAIALARDLPLIGVNHLEGHALSPLLTEQLDFPYLLLLASGGHCQFLAVGGVGRYRRLGSTIDDAAGEAFDKTAKVLGLGFPGGPALEACAKAGDSARFDLPRPLIGRPGCDLSFAGLKTAAARLARDIETERDKADLAASFQAALIDVLAERAGRAMEIYEEAGFTGARVVLAGGVAANAALRARFEALCAARAYEVHAPPLRYCTDNGAMIALAGAMRLELGLTSGLDLPARPRWPLDETAARQAPTHAAGRKGAKA